MVGPPPPIAAQLWVLMINLKLDPPCFNTWIKNPDFQEMIYLSDTEQEQQPVPHSFLYSCKYIL